MSDTGKTLALINATLPGVTGPKIIAEVDDWLGKNISELSSPPLDASLSSSESAAPANLVGDLKSHFELLPLTQKHGYYDSIPFTWESGSINYPSGGDKNPDANVIRLPLPRIQLTGNITFIVLNTKYRIKYYTFSAATGNATAQSSWYNSVGVYNITIDTSKYYRIQIATNTASSMNVEEALKSILIVYTSDKLPYVTGETLASQMDTAGVFPTWESGGITYTNGNNNTNASSIRTPSKRYYDSNIKVTILDSNYKIRFFRYSSSDSFEYYSSWYTTSNSIFYLDSGKKYRFEIATVNDSNIDLATATTKVLLSKDDGLGFWTAQTDANTPSYIESKVNTVNSYMTGGLDKTAFMFLTDTHWVGQPSDLLNGRGVNVNLMKYVADRCNIHYLIHGGDLNSEHRSDINVARENMTRPIAMMRDAFENVLVTRGNHDDNNEGTYKDWAYTISQSDSYSYMFRNTKDVVFGETGTYFYHDIPFEKVRIISLDCVDFPYTNEVDSTKLDEKILAYGHTQLQWLCDTLKNTPSGYHIVIYTHAMLAPSAVTIDHPNDSPQTRAENYLVVAEILKAYKNRSNYSQDITGTFVSVHQTYFDGTLSGNFTECGGTIVGVFSGHEHIDCIEEILDSDGNGIGIYNTCTQNSSELFSSSSLPSTYQHPMTIGTTTELVWDVVVIDKDSKQVDMIRIGAYEANTDVDAVTVRSFEYE